MANEMALIDRLDTTSGMRSKNRPNGNRWQTCACCDGDTSNGGNNDPIFSLKRDII
jgi:hypothetical protein